MRTTAALCLALSVLAAASGQITPQQNYLPVTITANSEPFAIIATPITPNAPYSQKDYQCNITGDTRFPNGGTFPLTVKVPVGKMVRVIFANGNLGGATVTQQGEAGVIVQQGSSPIVQQAGGASPIVQPLGSPVVQQPAPPAALVVQQAPTVVQPGSPSAPTVNNPPAYGTNPPAYGSGRRLLQDRVPGGPNNGLVEYVAQASKNDVPGFVVPNTQFGVPYVEFTSSAAAAGKTATFRGVLEVAQVVGGVPQYPFRPNLSLSPECQVNVNFQVA